MSIKHGVIIPLNGGMSVGAKMAYNNDPSWALSWNAFHKNESHFKKNFPNTDFFTLENEDIQNLNLSHLPDVDVIHSVPPCSALSSLNASWNNPKTKGSNAESTKWMHYSTEIALGKLKPKAFMFENAPGLLQKAGDEMRDYLIEKANKYNYSISFLFTDSLLHGIPQSRKRTFAFFWRSENAPHFEWFKRDRKKLEEFLDGKNDGTAEFNINLSGTKLTEDPFYKFAKYKFNDNWRDNIKQKTLGHWVLKENLIDEMLEWTNDEKAKKILNYWKYKLSIGKGFWDGTPLLFKGHVNAVIAKNIGMIHPHEDRYMNIRELMNLMALPKDYSLSLGENNNIIGGWNVLCQSVPSTTARDMFLYIENVINNKISYTQNKVYYGNNITQKEWS